MKTAVEMAREAGAIVLDGSDTTVIERLVELARADEREALAKDWEAKHGYDKHGYAAAIRSKGKA